MRAHANIHVYANTNNCIQDIVAKLYVEWQTRFVNICQVTQTTFAFLHNDGDEDNDYIKGMITKEG